MSDTSRVVIGSESNDNRKIELDSINSGTKVTIPVSIYDSQGSQLGSFGQLITVPYDALVLTYSGSNIATIKYYRSGTLGTLVATITLTYDSSNNLTSVVKT